MKCFENFTKGINLGGWLSQCVDNYNTNHYSTFITKNDIERISMLGVDHVRLPFDYNVIMSDDGKFIDENFIYIDNCIKWCREYKLSIVLDLHKTAGYVFDDENCNGFFYSDELQEMFYGLWEEMAKRYGNNEDIAFELLNEITDLSTAGKWNEISAKAISRIRVIADKTKIIIGGIHNSSIYGLSLLEKPADDNVVFTFHCYSPMVFTHQAAYWVKSMASDFKCLYPLPESEIYSLSHNIFGGDYDSEFIPENTDNISEEYFIRMFKSAVDISEKYNVPLYCGEYGVIDKADEQSTVNWFRDIHKAFEYYGISRSVWTYKQKDFGITDEHYKNVFDLFIDNL